MLAPLWYLTKSEPNPYCRVQQNNLTRVIWNQVRDQQESSDNMWQKVKAWTGPVASWAHSQQPGLPHLTSYSYLISYSHLLPPCVLSAYATRAAADMMQTSIFSYASSALSLSLSAATGAWTPPDQPPPLHPPIAHTWEERNLLLPVFLCAFMHVVCEPTASMRVWGTCSHDCACLTMRLQKNKKRVKL